MSQNIIVRVSVLPTILFGGGFINGLVMNQNRKVDRKYKYGLLALGTAFNFGHILPSSGFVDLKVFGYSLGVSAFATGSMFCMGHLTARMLKDSEVMS